MSTHTFDYIPRIILGKSSSSIYNAINLIIRAAAFYIYFKTSNKIDILEIILAYVFPIIYILYKVSETSSEYIIDLFLPSSRGDDEKCIERRGASSDAKKHGDKKSIEEDATACGNVEMGKTNSESECNVVTSVGDSDDPDLYPAGVRACLYIKEEEDDISDNIRSFNCSENTTSQTCNELKDNNNRELCQWRRNKTGECSKDLMYYGMIDDQTASGPDKCPSSCKYDPNNNKCGTTTTYTGVGTSGGFCLER